MPVQYLANWELVVIWVDDESILLVAGYLTIIPRVQMGIESIALEAEGRMGCWLIGYEGERNNCVS